MIRVFPTILLFLLAGYLNGQSGPDFPSTPEAYSGRRARLLGNMDSVSVLVLKGGEENGEEVARFRQDRDFLYLTGIRSSGARMILAPRGVRFGNSVKQSIFFLNLRWNPEATVPAGPQDTLLDIGQWTEVLNLALEGVVTVYYNPPAPFLHDWLNDKPYFGDREMRKAFEKAHSGVKIRPAGTLIAQLRTLKTEKELAALNKAIALTADGIGSVLKQCRPGMYEYEIQAMIEYEAIRQGASGMGFPSIIGGGPNSLIPHYFDNNGRLEKGDLLVMDVGAEVDGYSADVTRTIPVSGTFTPEQAEVYAVVLETEKELIAMVRPGMTYSEIDRAAMQMIREKGYGDYILHGVTHPIGLNVHDVMAGDTLKPGMVITIEPGIYIPASDTLQPAARKGFGIRIEDDVLVTETGFVNLSAAIPKEISEIEKRMRH